MTSKTTIVAATTGVLVLGGAIYVVTRKISTDAKRVRVIELAMQDVGQAGVGPRAIRDIGYPNTTYMAWCQMWALSVLRRARLTTAKWKTGVGFVGPLKLSTTRSPQPADLAYWDEPSQHMAFVVSGGPDAESLVTVDGAQAGDTVAVVDDHQRAPDHYYSIARLLT